MPRRLNRVESVDLLRGIIMIIMAIDHTLLQKALAFREEHTQRTSSYDEFKMMLEGRPGFIVSPWCGEAACEAQIKTDTQATIRNIPMGASAPGGNCVRCGTPAQYEVRFAKSY